MSGRIVFRWANTGPSEVDVVDQKQLADHIACDVKVINRIVNGRTSVTVEMAL